MTITGIPRPGRAIIVQSDGKFTLPCPAPLKTHDTSLLPKIIHPALARRTGLEHQRKGKLLKPSPRASRRRIVVGNESEEIVTVENCGVHGNPVNRT